MKFKIVGVDGEYLYSTKDFSKLQDKIEEWYNEIPLDFGEAIKIVERGKHHLITLDESKWKEI